MSNDSAADGKLHPISKPDEKLEGNEHHGIEEIIDMEDYSLSQAERIALGIEKFPTIGGDSKATEDK